MLKPELEEREQEEWELEQQELQPELEERERAQEEWELEEQELHGAHQHPPRLDAEPIPKKNEMNNFIARLFNHGEFVLYLNLVRHKSCCHPLIVREMLSALYTTGSEGRDGLASHEADVIPH